MTSFYAQWESASLAAEFLAGRPAETDPAWSRSGAADPADYAEWSWRLCGVACIRMVLADRNRTVPAAMDLRDRLLQRGGYVRQQDGRVHGLVYRPAAEMLTEDFGIPAHVAGSLTTRELSTLITAGSEVIASVHPTIRDADTGAQWHQRPPSGGGHLVLVTGGPRGLLVVRNPSGYPDRSQVLHLPASVFDRFYAERALVIAPVTKE